MQKRVLSTTIAVLIAALVAAPVPLIAQPAATPNTAGLTVPFSAPGTFNGGNVDVAGTFTVKRFAAQNGELVAIGTVAATIADAAGNPHSFITQVALPVEDISGGSESGVVIQQLACEILHLELGPLDLDLLGLVVHLDQIVLDITAVPGSGNLLGNLLCAIAGLLDGNPLEQVLNQIVTLLNRLLGAL